MEETHTAASATPILDRELPLPRAVAPRSGTFVSFATATISILLGVSLAQGRPAIVQRWVSEESTQWLRDLIALPPLSFLGTLAGAAAAAQAIHWVGQLLVARCAGFRVRASRYGLILPMRTDRMASRSAWVLLAGPAASVAAAGIVMLLPFSPALGCFVYCSLLIGLVPLIPYRTRSGPSAGARLWMLLRDRPRAERWLALWSLSRELDDGVLPEAHSPELLAKAIAVQDESPETTHAHALAYANAYYRGREAEAERFLEISLRFARTSPPEMRDALMCNAVIRQARQRGRRDLAERWLADLPARSRSPWVRTQAEAAVLEARGDLAGALRKLEEVERAISKVLKVRMLASHLTLLERWKSEVRGKALEQAPRPVTK